MLKAFGLLVFLAGLPGAEAAVGVLDMGAIIVLVCLSGLFSGLTLGLMGLDKTGLEIVIGAGESGENLEMAQAAKKIMPVRENGNLLLCTLLLGNVAVNALLSILMADLAGGLMGFLVSTAAIVILGEIMPQAACARYALQIGARAVPLVKLFMGLLYVIAKPISVVLDKLLGEEAATIHSRKELMKLLQIHVTHGAVDHEQGSIMTGAITFKDKEVHEIMTPVDEIFFLSTDARLNFKTISAIFRSGFSRIPVYGRDRNDIVGILFTKDLIFVDPEDDTPVRHFIHIFGRSVHKVWPDSKLDEVLKLFKKGRGHLALVHDVNNEGSGDPFYEVRGIITLEDIIEEILQDEIVDETDNFIEVEKRSKVERASFDYARLRLLDARLSELTLTSDEASALTAHLSTNYQQFRALKSDGNPLTHDDVREVIMASRVLELERKTDAMSSDPLPEDVLYKRGRVENHCTVVLTGHLSVRAGADGFASEAGPWSVLAADAVLEDDGAYTPDFTACVASDKVRLVRISREAFARARGVAPDVAVAVLERRRSSIAREQMQHRVRAVLEGETTVPDLEHRGPRSRGNSAASDGGRSRVSSVASDFDAGRVRASSGASVTPSEGGIGLGAGAPGSDDDAGSDAGAGAADASEESKGDAVSVEMIPVTVRAPSPSGSASGAAGSGDEMA